ncbi:MAG: sugar ABC transporter permease [Clostridia bacterium]|jgi:putative aldouronate transport system permease protein|nr:sugar ABC transporter permease [Clostridia bacterium]
MTSTAGTRKELKPIRKKGFFATLGGQWQLMLMSVPMFLYVLFFNYYPMYFWVTAFQDYKPKLGVAGSKWVGLKNFEWLFGRADFINSIRNTLAMSVINLVFGTVSAVLLAVLLNEVRQRAFKRTVQTVTYLPHFLSMVIVVGMAQNLFSSNGSINDLLMGLGLVKEPLFFLGEGKYFWWLVGVINVWKEVGWGTIIYISAMTSIDPCLYEAAAIDGAGRFQRILHVTLPGIKSTFVILLIMNIGHLMEAGFEIQYLLGNAQVLDYSQTIDVFVLKYGVSKQQYGVATAAGMFKSIVAILLLLTANFVAKRLDEDTLI